MFRGYVPTKGKIPLEKYKAVDNLLETPPTSGDYAGLLFEDVVQIDIDDQEDAKVVRRIVEAEKLQCNILKTTRGLHFYFRNTVVQNKTVKSYLPIGIRCDASIGAKSALVPLRVDGKDREWLQRVDELDDLPSWMQPIKIRNITFTGMGPGDGRNQELFNYILRLQTFGFNKVEIRDILRLINTYVFNEPLPQKELDAIGRDEAFNEDVFYKENKFQHDKFGTYLLSSCNIIKVQGILHLYTKSGLYSTDMTDLEKIMIDKISKLKNNQRQEVLKYIRIQCTKEKDLSPSHYIGLKNKILDIRNMKFIEYGPDFVLKNKVSYDYKPDAYDKTVDAVLDKVTCNDKELRLLLEEMMGYCLYRRSELGKAFILTEDGSNGKSTILSMIKQMIGPQNCSALEPKDLSTRFMNAQLYGKLANLGDDISNNYIENSSILKKLITGEPVTVEHKGEAPFEFNNYSKMIFCANEIPRINDSSSGLLRRLIIIPFKAKFDPSDPDFDPFIIDKLTTVSAMEYLLKLSIEALKRLLTNREFTKTTQSSCLMHDYECQNNPLVTFVGEGYKIDDEPVSDVYLRYVQWCMDNGLKPLSKTEFSRKICKRFNYESHLKSINGKKTRCFKAMLTK